MELELGLKFTRVAGEFTSDFQIAKDRAGILFLSRETDTMFVLTAHLKGYRRGNIKIDINEDGSLIGISGEKKINETVMVGWKVYKKDTEIKGFKKVFRIPDGVILDKIKAKFNEDESTLTITMPKKVKGIRGTSIEEVKEEQELVKEGSGNLQIVDDKSLEKVEKLKAKIGEDDREGMPMKEGQEMPKEEKPTEGSQKVDDFKDREEGEPISPSIHARLETETRKENMENQNKVDEIEERTETKDMENQNKVDEIEERTETKDDQEREEERLDEEKEGPGEAERSKVEEGGQKPRGKRCNMCIPIVAGSTLLVSFVVLVIQIIRSRNRSRARRE